MDQSMKVEDLIIKIKQEKETGHFSLQAIINRHYHEIESLKEEGYAYVKLLELFELGIEKPHFHTLIKRARKVVKKKRLDKPERDSKSPPVIDEAKEFQLALSIEEWRKQTGINMSGHLAEQLEANGFDPEKVRGLGIHSTFKLTNYLVSYAQKSKYK